MARGNYYNRHSCPGMVSTVCEKIAQPLVGFLISQRICELLPTERRLYLYVSMGSAHEPELLKLTSTVVRSLIPVEQHIGWFQSLDQFHRFLFSLNWKITGFISARHTNGWMMIAWLILFHNPAVFFVPPWDAHFLVMLPWSKWSPLPENPD